MDVLDAVPTPVASVVGRVLDQEAVLVLPEKGQVKVLNEVGARIWSLVDGQRTIRQIVEAVCAEYSVDFITAEMDTRRFLEQLVERGALTLVHPPSTP